MAKGSVITTINKADVQYLEYMAIQAAKKAGRYDSTPNAQNGTLPHLSPEQLDVIDEFREFVWLLTSFAGCKIFISPLTPSTAKINIEKEIFYLNWDGIEAKAVYGQGEISTPSRAAWIASGTGLNGWNCWKTKDGKSLDSIYRKGK